MVTKGDEEQEPQGASTLQDGGIQGQDHDGVDSSHALDTTMSLPPLLLQQDEDRYTDTILFQEEYIDDQASESKTTNKHVEPPVEAFLEAEKIMEQDKISSLEGEQHMVGHGICPSTKVASIDDAISIGGEPSDEAENGMFPSAMEVIYDTSDGDESVDASLFGVHLWRR